MNASKSLDALILNFTVRASVRLRGAIGIFWLGDWTVAAVTDADAKALWFAKYGETFELNHFVSVEVEQSDACEHGYAHGCRACDPDGGGR